MDFFNVLSMIGGVCLFRILRVWAAFPLNATVGMLYICFPISYVLSTLGMLIYFLVSRHKLKKLETA